METDNKQGISKMGSEMTHEPMQSIAMQIFEDSQLHMCLGRPTIPDIWHINPYTRESLNLPTGQWLFQACRLRDRELPYHH